MKRNIVLCNFNEHEKSSLQITDIRETKESWEENENHRFPYLKYVSNINDLIKSSGFLAIIKYKDLNLNRVEFHKKFYKKLKSFDFIIVIDDSFKGRKIDKYTRIGYLSTSLLYSNYFNYYLDELYENYYLVKYKFKRSNKIMYLQENILKWIKRNPEFSTCQIAEEFSVSDRTVQRYLYELTLEEYALGYDKSRCVWYYLK